MPETLKLPCPRLELRWEEQSDQVWICKYSLILPLDELDCRGNVSEGPRKTEWAALLGETKRTGASPIWEGTIDTPFRDATHIQKDNKSLGGHLPMFVVYQDQAREIERRPSLK